MCHKLSVMDDLIFQTNRIVIPTSLQKKVIKVAHHLGHLGITKTKQMLREKYWFPTMNSIVEEINGQCYECQVTSTDKNESKSLTSQRSQWDVVAIHFVSLQPAKCNYRQEDKISWSGKNPLNSIPTKNGETENHACHTRDAKTVGKWQWSPVRFKRIWAICQDRGISSSPRHPTTQTHKWGGRKFHEIA